MGSAGLIRHLTKQAGGSNADVCLCDLSYTPFMASPQGVPCPDPAAFNHVLHAMLDSPPVTFCRLCRRFKRPSGRLVPCRPDSAMRPAIPTFTSLFTALRDAAAAAHAAGDLNARAAVARRMHSVRSLLKSQGGLHPDMQTYRAMISAFQVGIDTNHCPA